MAIRTRPSRPPLIDLSRALKRGSRSSRELVEDCLARIDDEMGEGARAFLAVCAASARAGAHKVDEARKQGWPVPPFAGIPLAIKDLFDVAGETTRAGSTVLGDAAPAASTAPAVERLIAAGFILIGRTNMTEFAYSGLGINPHFGTPLAPFDRASGHIPGGSSSGSAVAVADGMACAAIGTDTGGSCRIPAAFCEIVGFKPTAARVPRDGVVPLSRSLDSVGPLANSVSCCAVLDSILSGQGPGQADVESFPEGGLRLGVLHGYPMRDVDHTVERTFSEVLVRLSKRGVRLTPLELPELDALPDLNAAGGIVGAEASAWHRPHLERCAERYDPFVRTRIEFAARQSAADYIDLLDARSRMIEAVRRRTHAFDALLLPTVAITPPTLADLADEDTAARANALCLRNTAIANFLDRPAISIPCNAPGTAPVGAMLMGSHGHDRRLLAIARGLEFAIRHGPA